MANINNPAGARIKGSIISANFNPRISEYIVPASDVTDMFQNDFIKINNTSENGIPICEKAAPGEEIQGIITSFVADKTYENIVYREAGTRRVVLVCDDPQVEFEIQATGTIVSTDIGKNADIVLGTGVVATGLSGTQLDHTTITTLNAQLKILRIVDTPTSELGQYTKLICMINEHQLNSDSPQIPVEQAFSFTSTLGQTSFSPLPSSPPVPALVKCYRNGNKALYGIDFTVSGTVLTWIGTSLAAGEVLEGNYNDTGLVIEYVVYTKTASATLTNAEVNGFIVGNSASDIVITVPETTTESVKVGSYWDVFNGNTGDITLAKEGSDVLNGNTLLAPQASARIIKRIEGAVNTYDILGGTDIQTFTIEHIITGSIANGTYRFSRPRFNGTIVAIYGILASGTADLDLEISTVAVTHTTLNLSSAETSQAATANNVFDNSDNIEYVITNSAAATRLVLTLECTGRL